MIKRRHWKKSPLAGKTVMIRPEVQHHLYQDFGGKPIFIIDWVDRTKVNTAYSMVWSVYSARCSLCNVAYRHDDPEILLGVVGSQRHIVHLSEIDQTPINDSPLPSAA